MAFYKDYKVYLRGFTPVSDLVASVTQSRFGKQGSIQAQLYTHWVTIVGDDLAHKMLPNKIVFPRSESANGTLYVDVYDAYALEIAHMEGVIIEKIAVYFGYKIVAKVMIKQKPIERANVKVQKRNINLNSNNAGQPVKNVDDVELRKVLENLSRSLANK